jgi:hypothetical protein
MAGWGCQLLYLQHRVKRNKGRLAFDIKGGLDGELMGETGHGSKQGAW